MVKISVITPCFNHGAYLDEAFKSIELNKYSNVFEHIIINDGSTDEFTLQKIAELETKGSIVIHQENKGLAEARNAGIKIAKGKYILPLDCDNMIIPEIFLEGLELLESNGTLDVVHTYANFFGEKEGIWEIAAFNLERMIIENHIDACSLIRKSTMEKVGMYSTDMPVMGHEDWELWIKIGIAGGTFRLVRKPGFFYRITRESMVNTISTPNVDKSLNYIFKKHFQGLIKLYSNLYFKNLNLITNFQNNVKDVKKKKNRIKFKLCVIVIPIYKELDQLTKSEIISLNNCLLILAKYNICFICPTYLNLNKYKIYCEKKGVIVDFKYQDSLYFSGINGYNKLLLSLDFYKRFRKFKYLLIYQLDAYVFRDELKLWCDKGYDYIGAPWFEGWNKPNKDSISIGVGNGGFSLRNVKDSIKLLKKLRLLEALEPFKNLNWKGIVPRLNSIICRVYGAKKRPCDFERNFNFYEDIFWCKAAPLRLNSFSCNSAILQLIATIFLKNTFKIAPVEDAVKFSFETNPREMYKMNNEQLPFGCHAWEKYDPEFWKKFIHGITSNELNNA